MPLLDAQAQLKRLEGDNYVLRMQVSKLQLALSSCMRPA